MNPKFQAAVGECPICKSKIEWFNDVPLRAFCWGTEEIPHAEMSRVVPGDVQPCGYAGETKWKKSKKSKLE